MASGKSSSAEALLVRRSSHCLVDCRSNSLPCDSASELMIADRSRFVQCRRMKRFAFLFLLFVPILVFAEGGLPDRPYIYVEGKAEIEKPADIMIVRFDIVGRGPQQPKA